MRILCILLFKNTTAFLVLWIYEVISKNHSKELFSGIYGPFSWDLLNNWALINIYKVSEFERLCVPRQPCSEKKTRSKDTVKVSSNKWWFNTCHTNIQYKIWAVRNAYMYRLYYYYFILFYIIVFIHNMGRYTNLPTCNFAIKYYTI